MLEKGGVHPPGRFMSVVVHVQVSTRGWRREERGLCQPDKR